MNLFKNRHQLFQRCTKRQVITAVFLTSVAIISGLCVFYYFQYQKLLNNPQISATHEVITITKAVGSLMELPSDEQPVIATVTDSTALNSQFFFKKALNGDKLLLFSQEKLAILYRPSENKIIMVAPIGIE